MKNHCASKASPSALRRESKKSTSLGKTTLVDTDHWFLPKVAVLLLFFIIFHSCGFDCTWINEVFVGLFVPFSAGVGRTGVFIALDHLIQHVADHDFVDVYGLVAELRSERMCMVQNLVSSCSPLQI